jgi:hypothetical protein
MRIFFFFQNELDQYLESSPVLLKAKVQADNCAMCEYGVHYLFEILQNKDDQEEVR